ncbi:MAG: heat-shock protein [Flavobacteriales bacterium]|nr:heat-shock protein [Flavobacteriales bacterium]|tara:strand:- start:1198 stop:1878 length:681 start_codon:yes stop_codon:yes gene_type:complete
MHYKDNILIFVKTNVMEKSDLVLAYTNHLLTEGKRPLNVYKFCQDIKIEESEFYTFFGSFEAIEKHVFQHLFDETQKVLKKNKGYKKYSSKEKLLSFYYTFIENLTANRSLVTFLLSNKNPIKSFSNIYPIKKDFNEFVKSLDMNTNGMALDKLKEFQEKGLTEIVWNQFLSIIKYWLKDDSPSFEKTDAFIEKSTAAGFEVLNLTQIESVIDFGKFLFKDTFKMN